MPKTGINLKQYVVFWKTDKDHSGVESFDASSDDHANETAAKLMRERILLLLKNNAVSSGHIDYTVYKKLKPPPGEIFSPPAQK